MLNNNYLNVNNDLNVKYLFIYEIDNTSFECFVTRNCSTITIDHKVSKVWLIVKLLIKN